MPENFTQYLIYLLIGLLFAKEYILAPLLAKFGFKTNGKNGNGNDKQIKELMEMMNKIGGNDLNHISDKLDKVVENTTKELIFLEDIRNELKK